AEWAGHHHRSALQGQCGRTDSGRMARRRRSARRRRGADGMKGEGLVEILRRIDDAPNLPALFFGRAAERGDAPFLWARQDGAWTSMSWREAARQVAALAATLNRLGLGNGERIALVSENRPEWAIAHLAVMTAGCVTVPAYTTNTER